MDVSEGKAVFVVRIWEGAIQAAHILKTAKMAAPLRTKAKATHRSFGQVMLRSILARLLFRPPRSGCSRGFGL